MAADIAVWQRFRRGVWTVLRYVTTKRRYLHIAEWNCRRLYAKDIRLEKDVIKRRSIHDQCEFECREYSDEVQAIDSRELMRRARRVYVDVQEIAVPENQETHWTTGAYGDRYLTDRSYMKIAKAVETAEDERWTRRWGKIRDWGGAVASVIAAATGLYLTFVGKK